MPCHALPCLAMPNKSSICKARDGKAWVTCPKGMLAHHRFVRHGYALAFGLHIKDLLAQQVEVFTCPYKSKICYPMPYYVSLWHGKGLPSRREGMASKRFVRKAWLLALAKKPLVALLAIPFLRDGLRRSHALQICAMQDL